jgi:hypothetical protein
MITKTLPDDSIRNLRRLQGDFHPGRYNTLGMQFVGVLEIVLGAACIVFFVEALQTLPQSFQWLSAPGLRLLQIGIMSVAILVIGVISWRIAGRWYRFGSGQVQMLSKSGTVVWTENLLSLEKGTVSNADRRNAWMKLYWGKTKRRVIIYPALAEAIKALEPPVIPPSEPIYLNETADLKGTESERPPWDCKSCGEENPGNFDECWKCQAWRVEGAVSISRSGPA